MLSSFSSVACCPLPNYLHHGLPLDTPRSLLSRSLIPIRKVCFSAAAASPERSLEVSWSPSEGNAGDGYGGWAVRKAQMDDHKDHMKLVLAGVGTSVAIFLAVLTYRAASRKGFQFRIDVHAVLPRFRSSESTNAEYTAPGVDKVTETKLDDEPVVTDTSGLNENSVSVMQERKIKIIHVAADPSQREAFFVLKKLKIIDDDVDPDELCTRREYARWLVKANSLLERHPRQKIVPLRPAKFTGLVVTAFDDVSVNDPDFWCIEALGEAGIVPSKLAPTDPTQSELLKDLMAGDNSITRRTFGNTRRLQPDKPATKAQAAVALASGRMAEVIRTELSRLDVEEVSRLAEMEEITSELIERGEIPRFWEEKLNKEKERVLEAEKNFQMALLDLEIEKKALDEDLADYTNEKAALDSQCQLLLRLGEEVDELRNKLSSERTSYMVEKESLEKQRTDLSEKLEAISERKSILEAEKEAIQILRSWVEEEAQRIRARAKFLAEAAQRWNWNNNIDSQSTIYNKSNNPESSSA